MAEGQVLRDAISIGRIDHGNFAEAAKAFRIFGLCQMASAGVEAQYLAGGGNFKPLGHGLLGFDAFGTSHKILILIAKERGLYATPGVNQA
jgi:hypothetical protein